MWRQKPLQFQVLLLLTGLIFFARSWSAYFVSDDYFLLERIGSGDVFSYFLKSWGHGNEYRPLAALSHAIDYAFFRDWPVGHHLSSTLLHLINALLVGVIASQLGLSSFSAHLAAVLFALNPVGHEAVLWISGRPVLLSSFLLFLSFWSFGCRRGPSRLRGVVAVVFFGLALLTYEGAVVLPFLLLLNFALVPKSAYSGLAARCLPFFGLLTAYVVFWNIFFGWEVTRFPVESSPVAMIAGLWVLLTQSFFGSRYGFPAAVYLFLAWRFLREKPWEMVALLAAMGICYLPFLLVKGFAPRFAYLAFAPASMLLAWMIAVTAAQLSRRRLALGLLTASLLLYYGHTMQRRITAWQQAGRIAQQILISIKEAQPEIADDRLVYVDGISDMHRQAYVFITGLEPAVRQLYPGASIHVVRGAPPPGQSQDYVFFNFEKGSLVEHRVFP